MARKLAIELLNNGCFQLCHKTQNIYKNIMVYLPCEEDIMINIVEECGRNAGRIWETLQSQGPMPETKLMNITKLKEHEFYAAVGWLARENKIFKDGVTFKLGNTNLTYKDFNLIK